MFSRTWLTHWVMLRCSLVLMLAGCGGGGPDVKPIADDERALNELGEVYRDHTKKTKRAPKTFKELISKGQSHPMAVEMIKSGALLVQWVHGCPLRADLRMPRSPTRCTAPAHRRDTAAVARRNRRCCDPAAPAGRAPGRGSGEEAEGLLRSRQHVVA